MPAITKWGSEVILTADPAASSPPPSPPYTDLHRFGELVSPISLLPGVEGMPMIYWDRTVTAPLGPFSGSTDANVSMVFRESATGGPYPTSAVGPYYGYVTIGNDGVSTQFGDIQEIVAAPGPNSRIYVGWIGHGSSVDVLQQEYSLQVVRTVADGFETYRANLGVTASKVSDLSILPGPWGLAVVYTRESSGGVGGSFSDDPNLANSAGVYARIIPPIFDATYMLHPGPEFRVNADVVGAQSGADIVALGANFLITWNDNGAAIKAKIYDSAGAVAVSDFTIASGAVSGDTTVTALKNGGFAVAWTQAGEVYARVFDNAGNAVSGPVQINDHTLNNQELPQVAPSADGGFIVVFSDSSFTPPDSGDAALMAQKFDFAGAKIGANVLVPTTLTGNHAHHELTVMGDGRIAVTWSNDDGGPVTRMQILDDRGALIYGDSGNNIIYGADSGSPYANNVLVLGDGNDGGYGLGGNDYIYGGNGNDAMAGGAGVDVLLGEAGNDQLFGEDDNDYLYGGDGNDALTGGAGVDVMIAGTGDDTMNGGAGDDYFYGEDGADTANGDDGNDIFVMGAGIDIAQGGDGQDYFYMGDGSDQMTGGAGVDVMLGEAGNDTFNSDSGVDYLFLGPKGAGDNDTVVMTNASGTAVVYDFEAGGTNDVIRLQGTAITTFAQAQAAITDYSVNGFIVLTVDTDTNIWLIGITPGQLTSADFLFA
jgi:Ca2+-binding RTX toxin-like protein